MCIFLVKKSWLLVLAAVTATGASASERPNRAALVVQGDQINLGNLIYQGTVNWNSSNVDSHTSNFKVVAEINIPYVKENIEVAFYPILDATKPYVINVDVEFPQNGKFRESIDQIGILEARTNSQQTGSLLAGNLLSSDGKFTLGLTEGDVNTNNLDLLLNDNWLEIPIRFKSGKQSKITFEKGLFGQKQIVKLVESVKAPW